jgi:hypothetical protein
METQAFGAIFSDDESVHSNSEDSQEDRGEVKAEIIWKDHEFYLYEGNISNFFFFLKFFFLIIFTLNFTLNYTVNYTIIKAII